MKQHQFAIGSRIHTTVFNLYDTFDQAIAIITKRLFELRIKISIIDNKLACDKPIYTKLQISNLNSEKIEILNSIEDADNTITDLRNIRILYKITPPP